MDYYPFVRSVIDALNAAQVPYMLVGALSSNAYGVARATRDADFVVDLKNRRVSEITQHLGPEFRLDPQVAFESVTGTYRHIVHLLRLPFKVEFFRLGSDEHDLSRFARRVAGFHPELQREVFLPTPEDVIVTKLRWAEYLHRNKDKEDLREVISVQEDNLDWSYIDNWTKMHGTQSLLQEIRSSIPEA